MKLRMYQVIEINKSTDRETLLKRVPSKRTAESVKQRRDNANHLAGRQNREIVIRLEDE